MIVVVGDGGVEDHASEQFGTVGRWLVGPAAQAVGHQRVRPALAVLIAVAAVQHGQPTDKAKALVSLAGAIVHVLPVEALQHQHVTFIANFLQPRLGDVEATAARKLKRGKFDALHVEAVTAGRKLAEPQGLRILYRRFWPSAAHAGAGVELFQHLRGDRSAFLNCLCGRYQFS